MVVRMVTSENPVTDVRYNDCSVLIKIIEQTRIKHIFGCHDLISYLVTFSIKSGYKY